MKSVFFFAALLACCINSFSQESEPRTRRYVTRPLRTSSSATTTPKAAAATIPTWTASSGTYTYEMVGQNPAQTLTNPTTTIGAPVIPVVLTFSDGTVFDPSAADSTCSPQGTPASLMQSSPIFNSYNYSPGGTSVGNTLYHDFFQRANFWQYTQPGGVNPNYHLLLNGSQGAPLKITVPSGSGKTVAAKCGRMGEMDINWFDNYLLSTGFTQLAANGVLPSQIPVFMLYNVAMYDTTASTCCILGYHSAFNNPNYSNSFQAYAVGDFDTTGDFGGSTTDVSAFTHELGELIDDPTGNNPTPAWGNIGQVTGCQTNLEVGDPLSGTDVAIPMSNGYTYHVQELAFLSWFYRQSPSIGVNGWYSSNGTFKTPAAACGSSSTTLSISPTTIPAGGSATVDIKVSAPARSGLGTPTGTVTLVSGSTGATLETWTLSNGAVSATVSNLPAGNYSVTAKYGGDATFSPSSSSAVALSVGSGAVSFSPASLTFASQALNTASASQTVTLTNKGTAPLGSIAISITGASPGDFSQTNNCPASLAINANCSIAVTFKPTASGTRTASISVSDNAAGSPQTASLAGTGAGSGTATVSVSPASLSFGNQNVGTSSAGQNITLSNTGTGSLTISSVQLSGANTGDFPSTTNCGHSLAAGSSCTVTVTFKPTATGSRSAAIVLNDSGTGSPQSVALSGTGVSTGAPAVTLSATALTFGTEPLNSQTAAQSVTITNSGTASLTISSLSLSGANPQDFPGTTNCPNSLAVNASCTVSLRFRPQATGARSATLSIADNVAGSPQTVSLSGTGAGAISTRVR
jgi:hypothetical protein